MFILETNVGDVFTMEYSQVYNRSAYTMTADGEDVVLEIGSPIMDGEILKGFALINGTIKDGETKDIPIMSNGFGVVVKKSLLPSTVTATIIAVAEDMGFKFLD